MGAVERGGVMGKYRKVRTSVGTDKDEREGVQAAYYYRESVLTLSGWYDTMVGINPVEMTLEDFLRDLGITLEDCRNALEADRG